MPKFTTILRIFLIVLMAADGRVFIASCYVTPVSGETCDKLDEIKHINWFQIRRRNSQK